ncbi:chorismate mutase family protein [Mycolicibacterium confluentis]|uniref:Uncharacterized protein n=1 Tax=Mycolicibacterium confluentis TaxID=28047 RepID=A0A7I7XRV7_9MYCO|nr:hypothetical protein [Mycolicibacterium confluentis]MCV7318745.1 hypothetical protein [Mycolicibacterium confluentis]ORV23132.1 hypothetical protein AWB99_24800 [Mycolicibacterium confluentis]BBZ31894.1 hypothetical protein MCNF_04990 [Mycolicibacterium confluentis]
MKRLALALALAVLATPALPTALAALAASRTQIDGCTRAMVEQIALHWDSLQEPTCPTDLQRAVTQVVGERQLDTLQQQALGAATGSYCGTI